MVPKRIRDLLGIRTNAELEITPQSDGILMRVVEEGPGLVKVNGLWVHRGSPERDADWERVIDDLREERIASVSKG